jgi:Fur family transcriptional regulator, peroxide stress response regulator
MNSESTSTLSRIAEMQAGLKRAGVKLTHQRLEICREIAAVTTHPDAVTVYNHVRERVPTISLDTVYRTLWTLFELGLIEALGTLHESIRFDGNTAPHQHFVCSKCRTTYDIFDPELAKVPIGKSIRKIGQVEKTQIIVRGICRNCNAS